jgi:hypothetical protein
MPLSTIFSYILAVNFFDGGNQSTRRRPQTCCKSLIAQVVVNPTITTTPHHSLKDIVLNKVGNHTYKI